MKGEKYLGDLAVDGGFSYRNTARGCGLDSIDLRVGTIGGLLYTWYWTLGIFLDQLSYHQLLKKVTASWTWVMLSLCLSLNTVRGATCLVVIINHFQVR
jgi:hypothetical protein